MRNWILPKSVNSLINVSEQKTDEAKASKTSKSEISCYPSGENSNFNSRGFFLIFNHDNYQGQAEGVSARKGTEHDVAKLKIIMTELGFTVKMRIKLKK